MSARSLETGELLSFLLVATTMLSSMLFFRSFYWVFILFAIIDGLSTRYRSEFVLSLDRIVFAFIILLLSAESLRLDVPEMILETDCAHRSPGHLLPPPSDPPAHPARSLNNSLFETPFVPLHARPRRNLVIRIDVPRCFISLHCHKLPVRDSRSRSRLGGRVRYNSERSARARNLK